jgi:spermidine synthase
MRHLLSGLVYLMFFLSGAAALIYEVVWARSLSLIFGGTHLAVTTVLAVFMGGLALGSYLIGRRVDALSRPLRFYGLLELGIALSALGFIGLMRLYPAVYVFLVRDAGSTIYLTFVRVLFACVALIVPATLMGGTLPVLARFVAGTGAETGTRLSLLYGVNTLGAVAGTGAAGFFLLRFYSVSVALHTAIIINAVIGLAAILLQDKAAQLSAPPPGASRPPQEEAEFRQARGSGATAGAGDNLSSARLVLAGIGISGFCALGYEVLWTRILTLTIGTSVYGFCIMLVAFLLGIALGSEAYGLIRRPGPPSGETKTAAPVLGFGVVQCIIGITALVVTFHLRDLPTNSIQLSKYFLGRGLDLFHARQLANLTLAFCYLVGPAFFMGLAFPLAGRVTLAWQRRVGHAVGDVLAYNTVGAILGSAVSGFFMIYAFGIERSLQLLAVINVGFGLLVLASPVRKKLASLAVAGATLAALLLLIARPGSFRMWDARYFAIFQNNQADFYDSPAKRQDAIANTDVLFYHEGADATISSIKIKGGNQALLVNGKVVASASLKDRQCQLTLGHLPMLLHKNPQKVLVVGLGTGMTLGAASVHPTVDELILAEIEPHVVGAARIFASYNNQVLDNPRLRIVFNDGRNFLLTTEKKFDVITADPIHPWTQGSGYLYTAEYFRLAAAHLLPGGIMCQWLPIYELSVADLRSVVKTFAANFRYTMAWLTQYDAQLIGSNAPIIIDEQALQQRIAHPGVYDDLNQVLMGSATDFLSYFVMGEKGMAAFAADGVINTDDNLYLEFSTPVSVGINRMGENVAAVYQHRESILPYLRPAPELAARERQRKRWTEIGRAAGIADRAHALFLGGGSAAAPFQGLMADLARDYPGFAPGRFIRREYEEQALKVPTLLDKVALELADAAGDRTVVEISAVIARVSGERAAVIFVDNAARIIFGQIYFSGPDLDRRISAFAGEVLAAIRSAYLEEAESDRRQGKSLPDRNTTMPRIRELIATRCGTGEAMGAKPGAAP